MRQPARRVFAAEYNRSDMKVKEGEGQYAPNFVVTPTGARCNRVFIVGVLTEVEDIGNDEPYYRARISDPTGTFYVYSGQYQPEATQTLSNMEPPEFVAVTAKTDLLERDGDAIPTLRPEAVSKVDRKERDRWIVTTARRTLERLDELDDLPEEVEERYHPSLNEYRDVVREALHSILGEEEESVVRGAEEEEPEMVEAEAAQAGGSPVSEEPAEPMEEEVEEFDFT